MTGASEPLHAGVFEESLQRPQELGGDAAVADAVVAAMSVTVIIVRRSTSPPLTTARSAPPICRRVTSEFGRRFRG